VQRDHREIEQLLDEVENTSGAARETTFRALVAKLEAHEAAEEEVVHPLAKESGAEKVADDVEHEEDDAKQAIAKLEKLDVSSTEFERGFAKLKKAVMKHAKHEENSEHPRIAENEPAEKLERLRDDFDEAEAEAND